MVILREGGVGEQCEVEKDGEGGEYRGHHNRELGQNGITRAGGRVRSGEEMKRRRGEVERRPPG